MSDTPGLLSLYNLLARASNVSCSKGASAFLSLLTTEDVRFSLAIDGFIPAIQNSDLQIPQRILSAYVLNALYVSHDHLNPFYDHLLRIFESERATAMAALSIKPSVGSSQHVLYSQQARNGTEAGNEQLVWALWKILQGEGDDLASFSPSMLSRVALPEHLQPMHLVVNDRSGNIGGIYLNHHGSTTESPQPALGFMGPSTSENSRTLFQTGNAPSVSQRSRKPSDYHMLPNRAASSSRFSPFETTFSGSVSRRTSDGDECQLVGRPQQAVSTDFESQSRYQPSPNMLRMVSGRINSPAFPDSNYGDHDRKSNMTSNQHQQALLRALYEESYAQSVPEPLFAGRVGIDNHPNTNQTGTSTKIFHETSRLEQQPLPPTPAISRMSTQPNIQQRPTQNNLSNSNKAPQIISSLASVTSNTRSDTRPRLDPISRPQPRSLSSGSSSLHSPASTQSFENYSVNEHISRPEIANYSYGLPREPQMRMDGITQQAPGIPFAQFKRSPTPLKVPPPTRSPGVIGSGRPSATLSKTNASVDNNTVGPRWSPIGVIGKGRPESSAALRDTAHFSHNTDATSGHENMIPFSVLRTRTVREESEKGGAGVIGQSTPGVGDGRERKDDGQVDGQTSLPEKVKALSIESQPQGSSHQLSSAAFGPLAPARNWTPNPDTPEFVSTHIQTLIEATPLKANTAVPQPQTFGISFSTGTDDIKNGPATVSPQYLSSSPPASASNCRKADQLSESRQSPPFSTLRSEEISDIHINEKERDELSHAIVLLLSSRGRVLTLTEQRMLQPHLLTLTQPLSLLRPDDIPPVVAKNTDIAAKLLVLLLDRKDEDAERTERILKEATKHGLFHLNPGSLADVPPLPATASLDPDATVDAIQAVVNFVNTCGASSESNGAHVSPFGGREAKEGYLDALRKLPPTMQSFNLVARLLRPTQHGDASAQQEDLPDMRVASLIRVEVLGGFVSGCVRWIERAEQEEKEGEVHDDRVAVAISSLCRFYFSLLKHGFVSAASEADTTEIMSFALQFSRFEEARSLYSTLAAART